MTPTNIVAAFDEDHAARLSGLSKPQLARWVRSGFFTPAHVDAERKIFGRVYSFHDIVALKVLHALRNQFKVSLAHLREVGERLEAALAENKWTGKKLYVVKGHVVWFDPESNIPQEIMTRQFIVPVVLDDVVSHTQKDLSRLTARDVESIGKIDRSRYVRHNAPIVAGTRVKVSAVKAFLDAGYGVAEVLREYPGLTEADVRAVMGYPATRKAA